MVHSKLSALTAQLRPVLLRARNSGDPFAELSKITPAVFGRSLLIGAGSGVGFWYLAA